MFSELFIRRPILATVCSLLIILAGAIAIPILPIARYPDLAPPSVVVTSIYTGANAEAVETAVTTPLEQAINGVPGDALPAVVEHQHRGVDDHRDVRGRARPGPRRGRRPEPGEPGARPHAGRGAHQRHLGDQVDDRFPRRGGDLRPRQPLRRAVHQQLRGRLHPRRAQARARGGRRHHLRRAEVRHADLARSRQARRPGRHRRRRGRARSGSRTCRWRRGASAARRRRRRRSTRSASRPRAG